MAEFDSYAYTHHIPCQNKSCRSFGRVHPHCECGPLGAGTEENYAKGGAVESFCSKDRLHDASCAYYADGGDVVAPPQSLPQFAEDSASTLGHAAVDRGLLGLLRDTGHPKMMDPERHGKILNEAKDQYAWRAEPTEEPLPQTLGRRFGNAIADGNHEKAGEMIHGHPLVGGASKAALVPILERIGQQLIAQNPHPEGMRSGVDFLSSSIKGNGQLDTQMNKVLGKESHDQKPDKARREALKEHLASYEADPFTALDAGGSLGHYLPVHGAQVAALSARAMNYFKSLKPMSSQNSPLDEIGTIDPNKEAQYDRQLDIANNPLLILQHAKTGSLIPQDIQTISTLYPALHQSMIKKTTEQLIKAGDKAKEMPYSQRQSLSLLMGQPLDSTLQPQVMQAIIKSQATQQAAKQAQQPKKASGVELNQINKINDLYKTPDQVRATDKHD